MIRSHRTHRAVLAPREVGSRCAVAALVAALALAAPASALAVPAEQELAEAKERLASLSEQLEIAQAAAETTELDLADTRERVSELEVEAAQTADALAAAREELSQAVVDAYKGGSPSLFELIFTSGSFDELTSRVYYASKVARAASDQVSEVQTLQSDLEAQRDELAAREDDLESLLAQQTEDQAALTSSLHETQTYVDGLSAEVARALEEERAAAAEAQRQQAEAAAQAAAEAEQQANAAPAPESESQPAADSTPAAPSTSTPVAPAQPSAPASDSLSSAQRQAIVAAAQSQVGVAYSYGACSPGVAFDCSGLTSYAYAQAGLSIPRTGGAQYRACIAAGNLKTSESALVAGDIVYYQTGGNIRHVGIYVGGGMVCHASDYSTGVIVTSIHYSSGFCGGGSPV